MVAILMILTRVTLKVIEIQTFSNGIFRIICPLASLAEPDKSSSDVALRAVPLQ